MTTNKTTQQWKIKSTTTKHLSYGVTRVYIGYGALVYDYLSQAEKDAKHLNNVNPGLFEVVSCK